MRWWQNIYGKKVLLHYGSGSVKKSGLLDRIKQSLDAAHIAYVELGGVVPNPRLSLVRKGIALCKKEGVDFLLPVGGGSNSDTCRPRFPIYLRTQRQKISAEAREME